MRNSHSLQDPLILNKFVAAMQGVSTAYTFVHSVLIFLLAATNVQTHFYFGKILCTIIEYFKLNETKQWRVTIE